METYNLVQHVQGPTHQSGHTLDLIITREDDRLILSPPVDDIYISDHVSLIFSMQLSKPFPEIKRVAYRKINKIDINHFKQDIQSSDLCTCPMDDLDLLVDQYHQCLSSVLDKHAPY